MFANHNPIPPPPTVGDYFRFDSSGKWSPTAVLEAFCSGSQSNFFIIDNTDRTKKASFTCSALATGTWQVYDLPDTGHLAATGSNQSWDGNQTMNGTTTLNTTTVKDAADFTFNTSTGSKLGTAVGQKIAFWGSTPVVQPAGAAQAAAAAQSQTTITDNTGGTPGTTLAVATSGTIYATDYPTIINWIASLAAELALIKADVAAIKTLQDATRTALVNTGMMKGAA